MIGLKKDNTEVVAFFGPERPNSKHWLGGLENRVLALANFFLMNSSGHLHVNTNCCRSPTKQLHPNRSPNTPCGPFPCAR